MATIDKRPSPSASQRRRFELSKALLGEQRAAHKGFTDFCVVLINSIPGAAASRPGERQYWRG